MKVVTCCLKVVHVLPFINLISSALFKVNSWSTLRQCSIFPNTDHYFVSTKNDLSGGSLFPPCETLGWQDSAYCSGWLLSAQHRVLVIMCRVPKSKLQAMDISLHWTVSFPFSDAKWSLQKTHGLELSHAAKQFSLQQIFLWHWFLSAVYSQLLQKTLFA